MMNRRFGKRGFALLLALGALALTAVLATTFVSLMSLERSASRNAIHNMRAMLAAESGIAAAVNHMQNLKGGALTADELANFYNQSPAFPIDDSPVNTAVSGTIGGTFMANGDVYLIHEIRDNSGKLNLNDTNGLYNIDEQPTNERFASEIAEASMSTVNQSRLYNMISYLVEISVTGATDAFGDQVADAILNARYCKVIDADTGDTVESYDGQIATYSDLESILVDSGVMSADQYAELLENVCLHGWQDPNVLRPTFDVSFRDGDDYAVNDDYPVFCFEDMQTDRFELEKRSPININTASKEMIQAMIRPLTAWYVFEGPADDSTVDTSAPYSPYSTFNNGIPPSADGGANADDSVEGDIVPGGGGKGGVEMEVDEFNESFDAAVSVRMPGEAAPATMGYYKMLVAEDLEVKKVDVDADAWDTDAGGGGGGVSLPPFTAESAAAAGDYDYSDYSSGLGTVYGMLRMTSEFDDATAARIAEILYTRIHDQGKPFRTWQEFELFMHGELGDEDSLESGDGTAEWTALFAAPYATEISAYTDLSTDHGGNKNSAEGYYRQYFARVMQDMVIAQFNPNARLNDYNPNLTQYLAVDKTQLVQYTTEACLAPTGIFEFSVEGRVYVDANTPVASRKVNCTMKVFETLRVTSQAQFLADDLRSPGKLGAGDYITPASGAKTPGDLALQVYPEPLLSNAADPLAIPRAAFADGSITLATRDLDAVKCAESTLLTNFAGSLDDEVGGQTAMSESDGAAYVDGGNTVYAGQLTEDKDALEDDDAYKQTHSVLYPDGAYSEAGRVLAFDNSVVFPTGQGRYGVLSFWMKPNFDVGNSPRIRKFVSLWQEPMSGYSPATPPVIGMWYLPHNHGTATAPVWLSGSNDTTTMKYANWTGGTPLALNSRSLVWGFRKDVYVPAKAATAKPYDGATAFCQLPNVSRNYPEGVGSAAQFGANPSCHLASHTWHHVVLAYNAEAPNADTAPYLNAMFINANAKIIGWHGGSGETWLQSQSLGVGSGLSTQSFIGGASGMTCDKYMRFGELSSAKSNRESADCTFDNIAVTPVKLESLDALSKYYQSYAWGQAAHDNGRYYGGLDMEVNGDGIIGSLTCHVDVAARLGVSRSWKLRDAAWTVYMPMNNRSGTTMDYTPTAGAMDIDGEATDSLEGKTYYGNLRNDAGDKIATPLTIGDPVALDIADNAGEYQTTLKNMAFDAAGANLNTYFSADKRPVFNRVNPMAFKLHFVGGYGAALMEAPVVDDVTFTFTTDAPVVLDWEFEM